MYNHYNTVNGKLNHFFQGGEEFSDWNTEWKAFKITLGSLKNGSRWCFPSPRDRPQPYPDEV